MTRIAILFSNYGPYHLARFQAFQGYCHRLGWSAIGIELTRSGIAYDWKTQLDDAAGEIISLLGEQSLHEVSGGQLLLKLDRLLRQLDPDVVAIAGYARPTMLAALVWSQWHRKSAILFSESKEDDAPRNIFVEVSKRVLLKGYRAALVGGKPHKRYLTRLGMPEEAIFFGYDSANNCAFHPDRIRHLPNPRERPYFLAVNRFIPKKNLIFLLSAYAKYRQQVDDRPWDLVLCGDGPLRASIEQKIARLSMEKFVHLPGFLQQNELLPYYAHAGCFIHASIQEQWGLVVNEAMAAGLPVLLSDRCGCAEDLLVEGVNGYGFDPENLQQLVRLKMKISSQDGNARQMGKAALEHIQKFSPDNFARGLGRAVEYALHDG